MKFGIAFNEASGQCLIRVDGNDDELKRIAFETRRRWGPGTLVIVMKEGFPINVLGRIKDVPEVVTFFAQQRIRLR